MKVFVRFHVDFESETFDGVYSSLEHAKGVPSFTGFGSPKEIEWEEGLPGHWHSSNYRIEECQVDPEDTA